MQPKKHIAILSRTPTFHTTERLVEAAKALGHRASVLNPIHCMLTMQSDKPDLLYEGKALLPPDVLIPRIGVNITDFGLAIVQHFESMGIATLNTASAIGCSRNKMRCLQTLNRLGIPITQSTMVRDLASVDRAIDFLGGAPVIIKTLQGSQGIGVMLAESTSAAKSIVETMLVLQQPVLLQKFYKETKGRDLRIFVINKQVVAAMERHSFNDDFRANIHRGGKGKGAEITPQLKEIALQSIEAIGLDTAGVDLLLTENGPVVLEVNSSPGIKEIESVSKVDLAQCMIDSAIAKIASP